MTPTHDELAGRRVFVVEDEWMVATLLEDNLTAIGCEVVGMASRLDEAREKAASLAFDVAILDINLCGKMTYPIAESLAARGISFAFATGYSPTTVPKPFRNVPILQKPFQQRDLERILRQALAKERRPGPRYERPQD